MKLNYLLYFFIILLNQENTIHGELDVLLHCYVTDELPCYNRTDFVEEINQIKKGFFECVRDAPEKEKSCGSRIRYTCGKVEIFFDDGDNVTFSGCERKDEEHLELCKERSDSKARKKWEEMFGKKLKDHNCATCEKDMCNSKIPVTKKPIVTSPSPSQSPLKKEQKSENPGVSPNMVLSMLLALLIFSF